MRQSARSVCGRKSRQSRRAANSIRLSRRMRDSKARASCCGDSISRPLVRKSIPRGSVKIHPTLPIYANYDARIVAVLESRAAMSVADGRVSRRTAQNAAAECVCPAARKPLGHWRVPVRYGSKLGRMR